MRQLEMECGTIITHVFNSLKDIHELHVEDCETIGTVIETEITIGRFAMDNRVIRQSKISICADTLPEVIKFLQEIQDLENETIV